MRNINVLNLKPQDYAFNEIRQILVIKIIRVYN